LQVAGKAGPGGDVTRPQRRAGIPNPGRPRTGGEPFMHEETSAMPTGTFADTDLEAVAQRLRDLDICILTTRSEDGLGARPMSNNGQVEWDGDTWFFARRDSAKIREIEADPAVTLGYVATERGTWVAIEADAEIVDDEDEKQERWFEDLRQWFPGGPEDPEVVLIRARANRVRAWGDGDELDVRRNGASG
jgi:general stress protein 26